MKNIFFAIVIVLAVFACNPPQSTTGTNSDSTGVNTSGTRDTSGTSTQTDTSSTPRRDTSMQRQQ